MAFIYPPPAPVQPITPSLPPKAPPMTPLYTQAKLSLGKHMTLNEAVPARVGCAEAVSAVLALAGITDAPAGIAGTASLYTWLSTNPRFELISQPEEGAVVVNPSGSGNGSIEGHTGIFGAFNVAFLNDWGIMSNDSASGKFLERWNWTRWQAYYVSAGGLPAHIFRFLG
jgi:hypothetical protein